MVHWWGVVLHNAKPMDNKLEFASELIGNFCRLARHAEISQREHVYSANVISGTNISTVLFSLPRQRML
jgi:hypothetical protein